MIHVALLYSNDANIYIIHLFLPGQLYGGTVKGAAWYTKNNNRVPSRTIFDSGSWACGAVCIRGRGTPCQLRGCLRSEWSQHKTPVLEIDHRRGV